MTRLVVVLLLLSRMAWAGPVRLITVGRPHPAWPGLIPVSERSVAVSGSRLLQQRGIVPAGFVEHLARAYDRLEPMQLPTALFATFLGQQRPESFDMLVVDAQGPPRPDAALVFLHGYMGNISLICWLVAQAARPHGLVTVCPSVGQRGNWWSRQGIRTLNATLQRLRQGIDSGGVRVQPRHLLLAGLSNGARGASVLAPRFRRQFDGLILISGLAPDASPPGMPTLVLHGRHDPAVPPAAAARYLSRARVGSGARNTSLRARSGGAALAWGAERATRACPRGAAEPRSRAERSAQHEPARAVTHVVLPGDHFVLLTHELQVRRSISRFVVSVMAQATR